MTMEAALRHERENTKHIQKVEDERQKVEEELRQNALRELPSYVSAWTLSTPNLRVVDFIEYWLACMVEVEQGRPPETMDHFIERYNNQYLLWAVDEWKRTNGRTFQTDDLGGWDGPQDDPGAWGIPMDVPGLAKETWDNIPGQWYSGDSFEPDAYDTPHLDIEASDPTSTSLHTPPRGGLMPSLEEVWMLPPPDPYLEWGGSPDDHVSEPLWPVATPALDEQANREQSMDWASRDADGTDGQWKKVTRAKKGGQGGPTKKSGYGRGGLKEGGRVNRAFRPRQKQSAKV